MLRADKLDVDRAFVLVIDLQEKLLPLIARADAIVRAARKLLEGAAIFDLPLVATEQYTKGLGRTHEALLPLLRARGVTPIEKATFSACGARDVQNAIHAVDRPQVLVAGIEAHICVLQASLDLRAMDYDVFVCADAVGSRSPMDFDIALNRLRQAGVFVSTVESALFELCDRCDTAAFKQMLEVIKAAPPTGE